METKARANRKQEGLSSLSILCDIKLKWKAAKEMNRTPLRNGTRMCAKEVNLWEEKGYKVNRERIFDPRDNSLTNEEMLRERWDSLKGLKLWLQI
jgi:hypothetical protein